MNRRIFYFSLLSLTISACSNIDNKRASGDFEYANKNEATPIIIPEGMNKPAEHSDFKISKDIDQNGPVGIEVDIRAPSLVLPVAASSRVIPESSDSIIWFDQVLENEDLTAFIKKSLAEQLVIDDVKLTTIDEAGHVYESDWYHSETESGWIFKSIDRSVSMRFRYELAAKPHGRSVSLKVSLIDYMETNQQGSRDQVDPIDKQRAEMAMLNEIVSQVDYEYRLQQRENRLMRANQKLVSIGENSKLEPTYLVEMDLEPLWSNLPIFFEQHGFKITDLNEAKHIYFVTFVQPNVSVWDKIWGDDVPVIDIENSKYKFVLTDANEQTALTIYREDGTPVPKETLTRIFPVMEPGLSFRNVY